MQHETTQAGLPTTDNNSEIWKRLWSLQQQIIDLQRDQAMYQKEVALKLESILDVLSQARGGWKVFIAVGTAVTTLVGSIAWVWATFFHVPR